MKTILAALLAGTFLISIPVKAEEKAEGDKAGKAEKGKKDKAAGGKEEKKDDKAAKGGGW